jgi:hypothetical protein
MDLLTQLLAWIQSLSAATSVEVKIAGFVALLLGLVNSSFASVYLAKLGKWKLLVAPLLGLVIALLQLPSLSGASVLAGLHGGALAIAITALLNAVEQFPGVGGWLVTAIGWIEQLLGAPIQASVSEKSLLKK